MARLAPLPVAKAGAGRLAPWIIAPMAYVATMALAVHMGLAGLTADWRASLDGVLTVEVPAAGTPEATASRIITVIDALSGHPSVRDVRPIDHAGADRLLSDWLGDDVSLSDLPLPTLIDVQIDSDDADAVNAVATVLAEAEPTAMVIDAAPWVASLAAFAGTIDLAAALTLVLVAGAATVTVVSVTVGGLVAWRPVVDLLHTVGADDRYIAGAFARSALWAGLLGGCLGLALAAATLAAVVWRLGAIDPTIRQILAPTAWQWLYLGAVPLATAVLAVVTARATTLVTLRRLV